MNIRKLESSNKFDFSFVSLMKRTKRWKKNIVQRIFLNSINYTVSCDKNILLSNIHNEIGYNIIAIAGCCDINKKKTFNVFFVKFACVN